MANPRTIIRYVGCRLALRVSRGLTLCGMAMPIGYEALCENQTSKTRGKTSKNIFIVASNGSKEDHLKEDTHCQKLRLCMGFICRLLQFEASQTEPAQPFTNSTSAIRQTFDQRSN